MFIEVDGAKIALGERLKDYRTTIGMTLKDVVEQANFDISVGTLSNYENDNNDVPSTILHKLLGIYGVSMVEFFNLTLEEHEIEVFKKYGLSKDFINALLYNKIFIKYFVEGVDITNLFNKLFSGNSVNSSLWEDLFYNIGHYLTPNLPYNSKKVYLRALIDALDAYAD